MKFRDGVEVNRVQVDETQVNHCHDCFENAMAVIHSIVRSDEWGRVSLQQVPVHGTKGILAMRKKVTL